MTTNPCGRPHYRYTESLCTEPAGHYVRERDPHAGPLIINGVQRGGISWDEPEEQPATDRIPLDAMTSDALDALYERLEAAEETESQRQLATAREAFASATTRAARAEAELAALRRVARGYCPHCGRGDAAPTTEDWEQQKQRADDTEQQLRLTDAMRQQNLDAAAAALQRAEQAEAERDEARQHAAAIAAQRDRLRQRMHALADRWDTALAVDKPYARTLRNEISVAPFDPEGAMTVREYTERGRRLWAFRCWGTDTCEGWLGLGHHTQSSALIERERHVAEAHAAPAPAATEAPVLYQHFKGGVYEVTGTATHTSSGEQLVVYRAADGQTWARPMDEFTGTVDGQPRFTRIETTAATDEPA